MATAARMPTAARTRTWLLLCLGFLSRALGQVLFYEETCDADAFNSGINTNAAQFLRKNIVRMGTCVQAPDTPAGMAEIFNCESGRGEIFLTSTLYTRSDCLETEVADEGTYFAAFGGLPGEVNRQLFSRYYDLYYSDCTIGLEQLTVGTRFQCIHSPAWLRDPTWVGAVGYDMWPDTPSVEDCPANKLPNVRAYSTECVKMGISEPDSRLYTVVDNGGGSTPSNQSSVSQLTYPSGFCNCPTQNSQNCDVNPSATKTSAIAYPGSGTSSDDAGNNGFNNKAGACGLVQLLNYSSETNELIESPGYFVTNGSLIESSWGRYSLAETEKVKPPLDVQALLITGGVVCTLCCCCLGFLAYMMNYWALKAEKYDGRETDAERLTTQDRWISRDVTFIVEKPRMYTHSGSIVEDRSVPGLSTTSGLGPQRSVKYDDAYSKWQESYSAAGRFTNQTLRSQSVVSLSPSEGQGQSEYNLDGSAEDLYGGGGWETGVTRKVSFTPSGASPRKMSLGPGGVEVGLSLAVDSPMHRRGSMQPTLAERRASIAAGAGAGAGVVGGIRKVSFAGSKVTEDAVGEVTSPDSRRGSAHPERKGSVKPQSTEDLAKHERKKSHAERKKSHAERKMSRAERRKTKKSSMVPLESSSLGPLTTMTLGGIAEDEDEDEDEASVSPPTSRSAPASALGDGDTPIEDKPFFPSLRKASMQPQQGQGEGSSRRKTKQAGVVSARHALL